MDHAVLLADLPALFSARPVKIIAHVHEIPVHLARLFLDGLFARCHLVHVQLQAKLVLLKLGDAAHKSAYDRPCVA